MNGSISVIYEKGVLRPWRPLDLPERTRLEIQIVSSAETMAEEAERAAQVLVAAGLIQPLVGEDIETVEESERRRAADAFGDAGPLSDVIIADRRDE